MWWVVLLGIGVAGYWWLNQAKDSTNGHDEGQNANTADVSDDKDMSREAKHLRSALAFAQTQHQHLSAQEQEKTRWRMKYAVNSMRQLDALDGVAFEEYLAGLFMAQGYQVHTTAVTGDFGADLILTQKRAQAEHRIAVQAKRWRDPVGVGAVQEVLAGARYYNCQEAWVVTTARFTVAAKALAQKSAVKLIDRDALAKMLPVQR